MKSILWPNWYFLILILILFISTTETVVTQPIYLNVVSSRYFLKFPVLCITTVYSIWNILVHKLIFNGLCFKMLMFVHLLWILIPHLIEKCTHYIFLLHKMPWTNLILFSTLTKETSYTKWWILQSIKFSSLPYSITSLISSKNLNFLVN